MTEGLERSEARGLGLGVAAGTAASSRPEPPAPGLEPRASDVEPDLETPAPGPKPPSGFTLLEVMVALAILALSLTALLGTQSSSVVLTRYINNLTVASLLAKGKMLDLEHELKKDGFDAFGEDHESGNFSEEGHPEVSWEAQIEKIELDESSLQNLMESAPQSREDVVNKLMENPQLAGMDISALNFNPGMIFSFVPTAIEMLGEKVRKCTLTVSWKDGRRTRSVQYQTYFVQYEEPAGGVSGTAEIKDDAGELDPQKSGGPKAGAK